MASELYAVVSHLFAQPLFLRLIVLVCVVTVFSSLVFVVEGLRKRKPASVIPVGLEGGSLCPAMRLTGQKQ